MFERGDLIAPGFLRRGSGRGDMAVVYRTVHQGTNRAGAIKVPLDDILKQPKAVELFLREACVGEVIGNVWEWVQDWSGNYPNTVGKDIPNRRWLDQ